MSSNYIEQVGPSVARNTNRIAPLKPNIDDIFYFCNVEIKKLFMNKIKENNMKQTKVIIINDLNNRSCDDFTDFTISRLMTDQNISAITEIETLRFLMNLYIDHIISDLHRLSDFNKKHENYVVVLRCLNIDIEREYTIISEKVTMEITYYVNNQFLRLVD